MKNILSKTKHFVKGNKWWTAGIILLFLIIIYFVFLGGSKENLVNTIAVERKTLTEEVSVTGNVKPLSDLSLSFEKSGLVANIAVSIGDEVRRYEYMASLSNDDLAAAVEQAKAGLKIAQANLESLKKGSTPEQIAVAESQVSKAQNDLNESKNGLINALQDAFTKSDDSIRNKIDLMMYNPETMNVSLKFQTDFQLSNDLVNGRIAVQNTLSSWNASTSAMINANNMDGAVSFVNGNLNQIKDFLEKMALAINSLTPTSDVTQTTIDTWKANVSTARTNMALAISNLATAFSSYKSLASTLKISQDQLTVTKSGATGEQIDAQEATVEQAEANLASAQAQLSKSIIRSPIDGVISRVDAKVGQVIQPGVNAVSVISYGEYEVESFVPEADIAKIKVDQEATTTLDAYGSSKIFKTRVVKIDPAETVIDGVPTYKITLRFTSREEDVKSGMTANMDILTNLKTDILAVPSRSVYSINDKRYVKVVDENITTEREVKTGIRGVDGYIEIVSGLEEGEKIMASPNL